MPTVKEPEAPGLDDRFCPACGGRRLTYRSVEDLAEDGIDAAKECFVADDKVAWACNDCGFETPAEDGGIPTLRHLLEDAAWWLDEVDVGRLIRWAVRAEHERSQKSERLALVPFGGGEP